MFYLYSEYAHEKKLAHEQNYMVRIIQQSDSFFFFGGGGAFKFYPGGSYYILICITYTVDRTI